MSALQKYLFIIICVDELESEILAASGSRLALAGGHIDSAGGGSAEEEAEAAASAARGAWREPPTFALIPKNQLGEMCLDTARLRAAGITDRLDVEKLRVYLLLLLSNMKDALLLEPFSPRRSTDTDNDPKHSSTHNAKGKARNKVRRRD